MQRPPKPPTPKPPLTPRKPSTDHGPVESVDSITAIYAMPGHRPPIFVDVEKKTCAVTSASTSEYAEVNFSPESNNTSKYPPTWNLGQYAEIEINSRPTSSAVVADYEYADPNAINRWALQHIARGVNMDSTADSAYAVVDVRSGAVFIEFSIS